MDKDKPKVLFVSDLVVETGFSTVAHNIIKYNEEYFDITGLGVNYNGDPHNYDFKIYPAMTAQQDNMYGIDRFCAMLNTMEFDLVFILNDPFVIGYYLDAIKKYVDKERKLPKIVVYFPVDSKYHNPAWYKDFDLVSKAYTYTEFGKKVVKQCAPNLEVGIIPHGVSSTDFYKIHETKQEAKLAFFKDRIKDDNVEDLFIVLNANRNQPRKKLDITIAGFSLFAYNKPPNVRLYMHSGVTDSSVNTIYLSKRYGVNDRLIVSSLKHGIQRTPVEVLNRLYNACDIGINTSMGEGWGLTNMEHAVTEAVQVVPRHSACEELFSDCGLLMDTITDYTFDNSQTVGRLTTPTEVARCLEVLYRDKDLRDELSVKSLKKFTSKEYQWSTIAEKWREVFYEVHNAGGISE